MEISDKLSSIAIGFSILALIISGITAWFSVLRPAKISAIMPHIVMWQFSSWIQDHPTGDVVSRPTTPNLMIKNLGARPFVIEDLRMLFKTNQGDLEAYPTSKVPDEVIDAPGNNKRWDGLGEGTAFSGIILSPGEEWTNNYAFSMNVKSYELLKGDVRICVQIRKGGNIKWMTVLDDIFAFGSMPFHLRPLKGDNTVAGSMSGHVYSKRWNDARTK